MLFRFPKPYVCHAIAGDGRAWTWLCFKTYAPQSETRRWLPCLSDTTVDRFVRGILIGSLPRHKLPKVTMFAPVFNDVPVVRESSLMTGLPKPLQIAVIHFMTTYQVSGRVSEICR